MGMVMGEEGTEWCKRQQHYNMNAMETFSVFSGQTIKNRFEFVFVFEFKVW